MRNEEVIIAVCDALGDEKRYVFHEPERCLVGRGDDCDIPLPADSHSMEISRHHCLLEIDPPRVFIGDLGSRNGTFVNGVRLGRRREQTPRIEAAEYVETTQAPITELRDGDQVQLGKTALRLVVEIRVCELQTA